MKMNDFKKRFWTMVKSFVWTINDCFDLIDITTICAICRTPVATTTVANGDSFFRQRGDQLNGGKGTVDMQPEIITGS